MRKLLTLVALLSLAVPAFAVQMEKATVHNETFFVRRDNITTASVNIAFGFTISFPARKIQLITPSGNTDDVCVDFFGGTAVCPAANTAGNMRMAPGESLFIDDISFNSVSVIANSGTQEITVRAWR